MVNPSKRAAEMVIEAVDGGTKHDQDKPAIHLIDADFISASRVKQQVSAEPVFLGDTRERLRHRRWLEIYSELEAAIGGRHIMLNEIAHVLAFGANKYSANNWRKGMAWSRLARATLEHVRQFDVHGRLRDPESRFHHLGHAGCCVMFLWWYNKHGVGTDDLDEVMFPKAGPAEDKEIDDDRSEERCLRRIDRLKDDHTDCVGGHADCRGRGHAGCQFPFGEPQ